MCRLGSSLLDGKPFIESSRESVQAWSCSMAKLSTSNLPGQGASTDCKKNDSMVRKCTCCHQRALAAHARPINKSSAISKTYISCCKFKVTDVTENRKLKPSIK